MKTSAFVTAPDECKVFTPPSLARAMAGVLPDSAERRWLEPCVGKGVFLDALTAVGVDPQRITAVELDHHDVARKCGVYYPGTEFLTWSLETKSRFDRIIGNPPFLKLHRAHPSVVQAALRIEQLTGGRVPLRANCWYAFLCASLRLLRPNGGICLVLPAGWEYADYASDLRRVLPQSFARFEIVRGARSFFRGILDGCVVLIADGYGQPNAVQRRFEFPALLSVVAHLSSANGQNTPVIKPSAICCRKADNSRLVPFGDVARVRIGAVTGAARYFLFDEGRRIELGIDLCYVRPVLTRARHLEGPTVAMSQWRSLRDRGERVWLFWPRARPGRRPRAIEDYLAVGLQYGIHNGQKTSERDPWYLTETNPPADGFMSGMTSMGPWLCLNRAKDLTATNTLYTIHFRNRLRWCEQAAWALSLLSTTSASQYETVGRCYSKGLLKFEPQDVMDLRIPIPVDSTDRAIKVYNQAVTELLSDRVGHARRIAEAFVTGRRVQDLRHDDRD